MRPHGEVRAALRCAAESLSERMPHGLTYRDLAEAGRVGYQVARETCRNMARSGELKPVGTRQVQGAKRPLKTYVPAWCAGQHDASRSLAAAMGTWASSN